MEKKVKPAVLEQQTKSVANDLNMSVGSVNRNGYSPSPKTSGVKVRGTGAATKGKMARGPMA